MAKKQQPSDTQLVFLKVARITTYIVYAFTVVAVVFLTLGFFMLLFGANYEAGFTQFIYNVAAEFLQPFRGIFPSRQIGETGYFSASALFAIIIYLILAMSLHALITFITTKQVQHETELNDSIDIE